MLGSLVSNTNYPPVGLLFKPSYFEEYLLTFAAASPRPCVAPAAPRRGCCGGSLPGRGSPARGAGSAPRTARGSRSEAGRSAPPPWRTAAPTSTFF